MNDADYYDTYQRDDGALVKAWTRGVVFESKAKEQVYNVASLPFIHGWVAIMPDVHWGMGATIGSVIPTRNAVIPAAVGVDIGCGMMAVQTTLKAGDLPDNLRRIRSEIEGAVPHGRTRNGGNEDRGAWSEIPAQVVEHWAGLSKGYEDLIQSHSKLSKANSLNHLGTLGTGNHFIELCLDESDAVWVMLHSGSRGIGNRIGMHFIELAKKDARVHQRNLPDINLAYLKEGTEHFDEYIKAVGWAQDFAKLNRRIMMESVLKVLSQDRSLPPFQTTQMAVNCHHNYVQQEKHFGERVWVTRKGALRAGLGELGIIPGSMGARSFIVRGKGNSQSFHSASHGAGRVMSRKQAKKLFTVEDHKKATQGIECRIDADVLDETPGAYKNIDAVMGAQKDLVDVVHILRQVICVKG